MGNDVLVPLPVRKDRRIEVEFICRCSAEIGEHPTKYCPSFKGDRIREVLHRAGK